MNKNNLCLVEILEDTGERMIPEKTDKITFWEHIYRYRFASKFVARKHVLDIACGEGYGTAALLKAGARSVVGIDISEEACNHGRRKYGINTLASCAENISLPDNSIDVIISFETIEHLENPNAFLSECIRLLTPNGFLIMSTPNRDVYSRDGKRNHFHSYEFDFNEFVSLLRQHFQKWRLYTQWPHSVAWWSARSLAASSTSWVNVRGFWHIRQLLRSRTCPHIWGDIKQEYRMSPIELILSRENSLSYFVNPYLVRSYLKLQNEQPRYFITVARS